MGCDFWWLFRRSFAIISAPHNLNTEIYDKSNSVVFKFILVERVGFVQPCQYLPRHPVLRGRLFAGGSEQTAGISTCHLLPPTRFPKHACLGNTPAWTLSKPPAYHPLTRSPPNTPLDRPTDLPTDELLQWGPALLPMLVVHRLCHGRLNLARPFYPSTSLV